MKIRTKYNWQELKGSYFLSPIIDVSAWTRQFFGSDKAARSGNIFKQTKNWRKDKLEYLEELRLKTCQQVQEEHIGTLRRITQRLYVTIEQQLDKPNLPPRDIKILWQIIRTEQGLPTDISSQAVDEATSSTPEFGPTLADAMLKIVKIDEEKKRMKIESEKEVT